MKLATCGALWRPAAYHGVPRRSGFEGWYFKLVNAAGTRALAVIPGIYHSSDPALAHSFVQVSDSASAAAAYFRYPYAAFQAIPGQFDVRIGPNHFNTEYLSLDLEHGGRRITGEVHLGAGPAWPVRSLSPGVMGPFAFVPGLRTHHGVLNMDSALAGSLMIDGGDLLFDGGRGYLEKDWGSFFPSAWVWMQSNHFAHAGTSLVLSIARVPWVGISFKGFFVGLLLGGALHRFTTYRGDRLEGLAIDDTHIELAVANAPWRSPRERLQVSARRSPGVRLREPTAAGMAERLVESLTAELQVELVRIERGSEAAVFSGTGRWAGLEVGGRADELTIA